MLELTIPAYELFNEETQEFINEPERVLKLEHSLVSISKWEANWNKPFLSNKKKTFDEALKKYPKYASVIKKLNSLTDYGRYDVSEIKFDEVQEKLVPYWVVSDDYSAEYYIFLDNSKKHIATIEDIAKITPLNANSLNSNSKWKVYNVKDELSKKHTTSAKKDLQRKLKML